MKDFSRRDSLKAGAGLLAGAAVGANLGLRPARAQEPTIDLKPEAGATLRVLRPAKFVAGDEKLWLANTEKYTQQTGVQVKVESQGWEDLRPKSAVAANVGKGPDVVYGWYDDAHQYPEKLVDVSDLAEYLDKKYGGWYDVCKKFGMRDGRWISIPLGAAGARIVYRISALKEAGFDAWPTDMNGMLKVTQALAAKGKPGGLALGNAVGRQHLGHWLVWSLAARWSTRTIRSSSTAKPSPRWSTPKNYASFVPGTLSCLILEQGVLDSQISWTINGIPFITPPRIPDAKIKALVEDINHAVLPVGRWDPRRTCRAAMVFAYTPYPNAAKNYIRFMLEREQYVPWQEASLGYFSQPLKEYEKSKIWTVDPKHTPYRDLMVNMQWPGYAGSLGYASAGVMADFVMVNMVAQAASGDKSPADAAAEAQKRAERYYKI
jgi:multiple sugar transport system substrate-binding protein